MRRFANSLLDGLAIGALVMTLNFIVSLMLGTTDEEAARAFDISALVALGSVSFIVPVFYFLVSESVWGRTIGKLATDTKVVDYTGAKPSFGRVFLRTICRNIPFNQFSFLFKSYPRGWHDKISGTLVVPNDATPESVAAMDRAAADKTKAPNRFWMMLISILGILQLLAIPFFIIMTAMFFMNMAKNASPSADSRAQLDSAFTRSAIMGMAFDAEMYRDTNSSYEGFCTDNGTYGGARSISRAKSPVTCNDVADAWAASAPITTGYWCADSTGFGSTTARGLGASDTSCPQ